MSTKTVGVLFWEFEEFAHRRRFLWYKFFKFSMLPLQLHQMFTIFVPFWTRIFPGDLLSFRDYGMHPSEADALGFFDISAILVLVLFCVQGHVEHRRALWWFLGRRAESWKKRHDSRKCCIATDRLLFLKLCQQSDQFTHQGHGDVLRAQSLSRNLSMNCGWIAVWTVFCWTWAIGQLSSYQFQVYLARWERCRDLP